MADKKLALELLINVQNGNLTLEELNQQLAKAKQQLEQIGDKGSQQFNDLSAAIQVAENKLAGSNTIINNLSTNASTLNENLETTEKVIDAAAQGMDTATIGAKKLGEKIEETELIYRKLGEAVTEQKGILLDFEKTLLELQAAKESILGQGVISPEDFRRQAELTEKISEYDQKIKDVKVNLRVLNQERSIARQTLKDLTKGSVNYNKIVLAIDKLTGGMATKVVKLYKGFKEGTKLLKGFVSGLSKFQKALIGTGIGAFVVALGVVAAYWDDIVALIDGGNKKLEKQLKQNQDYGDELDHQLTLLELEEQILEQQGLNTEHIVAEQKKVLFLKQEQIQRDIELFKLQQKRLIQQGLEPSLLMKITEAMTGYKAVVGNVSEEEKEAIEANKDRIKEAEENAKKLELALKKIDADKKRRDTKSANEEKKAQEKADKEAERLAKEKEKALEQIRKGGIVTKQQELDEELLQVDRYYNDLIKKAKDYIKDEEKLKEQTTILEAARAAKKKEIEEREAEEEAKRILKKQEERAEELEEEKLVDEENFAERRAEIDRREKLILDDKIITEEQRTTLLQALASERKQLKLDELAVEKEVEAAKFQLAKDVFTGISNLASLFASENEASARRQFELNKALSIGQTIIATYEGAQNAYRTAQKSPYQAINPAYAPIQAGLAIVAGLAQVKKISSTQFKSKSVDTTTSPVGGQLGGGDIGTQPRGFLTPSIDTGAETTKVIVTETDIRNVSRNVDGVYSRATVVQ
jgi:hypothetical protein